MIGSWGRWIACEHLLRSSKTSLLEILETALSITKPDHIYSVVVAIFKKSVDMWNQEKGDCKHELVHCGCSYYEHVISH